MSALVNILPLSFSPSLALSFSSFLCLIPPVLTLPLSSSLHHAILHVYPSLSSDLPFPPFFPPSTESKVLFLGSSQVKLKVLRGGASFISGASLRVISFISLSPQRVNYPNLRLLFFPFISVLPVIILLSLSIGVPCLSNYWVY